MKKENKQSIKSFPPKIKYVKKARMWCVVYCENKAQKQDWFSTKEEADLLLKKINKHENI